MGRACLQVAALVPQHMCHCDRRTRRALPLLSQEQQPPSPFAWCCHPMLGDNGCSCISACSFFTDHHCAFINRCGHNYISPAKRIMSTAGSLAKGKGCPEHLKSQRRDPESELISFLPLLCCQRTRNKPLGWQSGDSRGTQQAQGVSIQEHDSEVPWPWGLQLPPDGASPPSA